MHQKRVKMPTEEQSVVQNTPRPDTEDRWINKEDGYDLPFSYEEFDEIIDGLLYSKVK